MKERPILFSGQMVRTILGGRKTQTRRVVKLCGPRHVDVDAWHDCDDGSWEAGAYIEGNPASMGFYRCPYGGPGDRLWVREAWRTAASLDALNAKGMEKAACDAGYARPWAPMLFPADGARVEWEPSFKVGRYRHARFMPRWGSRITLEVVAVRVERLQAISEEDAAAEGVDPMVVLPGDALSHAAAFGMLWDSINHKSAPWDSNPWVWVIEFERVSP